MIRLKEKHTKAIALRRKGFSLTEIKDRLSISKGTASLWLRDVKLKNPAIERLASRANLGRARSHETRRERREMFELILKKRAAKLLNSTPISRNHSKIICACLFRCEGNKNTKNGIQFTNSDPLLVKTFIMLLKSSFSLRESKFRASLHLHEYHSPRKQILFWSKITGIPTSQFIKPYQKPHTSKRIKKDYPGCINIRYYDSGLAREISLIAEELLNKYGGVG